MLVEVLSPSTALKDRNEKLKEYTQSKTPQEYILVSQHEAQVEIFSRYKTGESVITDLDKNVDLSSIECALELSRIYRKITLDVDDNEKRDDRAYIV